jgi:hypothetical protein
LLETPVELPDGTRVRVEIEPAESEVWGGKNIEELAQEQGVKPIEDPSRASSHRV